MCANFETEPVEFNGEHDHVRLLVHYSPKVAISRLVGSLNGVSARRLRQEFPGHVHTCGAITSGLRHPSPHPATAHRSGSSRNTSHTGQDIRRWAKKNKVELCFTPNYASWANPIEAHFGPLRQFTLANSHHRSRPAQTQALHRYLRWRNANARHPDVLAAQRRERARVRSEEGIRWGGRPSRSRSLNSRGPRVTFARTGGASHRSGWARPPGGTGRAVHRGTPRAVVRTRALPVRPPHAWCRRGRHRGTAGWW
ncbi:hypothetical protein SRB17_26930 [Streptomyces sp. RB17]|nr:hypothetical protein [Streptomyces sp. RB17]